MGLLCPQGRQFVESEVVIHMRAISRFLLVGLLFCVLVIPVCAETHGANATELPYSEGATFLERLEALGELLTFTDKLIIAAVLLGILAAPVVIIVAIIVVIRHVSLRNKEG